MIKARFINPERRDLLKQLAIVGALSATGFGVTTRAQLRAAGGSGISAVHRGDEGYDALRSTSLWRSNMPERYPDVIVEAESIDDLREALAFARDNDLQIVARGGGHSTAGAPLRNGGMMIYLRGMNGVSIDREARTATIEPGVTMAGLYGAASRNGLDFPTADCSTVGLPGFILGGGFGRNCMHLTRGPVCIALIEADVMLANGEIVTVNEESNADLFWAMRGCGPAFFGIVTRMKLQLFDPPGAYLASTYQFPFEALPSLIDFLDRHEPEQDPRVSNRINIRPHPANPADAIVLVGVGAFADPGPSADAQARARLAYYADAGLGREAAQRNEYETQRISAYMMTTDPTAGTHTDNVFTDDASSIVAASQLMRSRPDGFAIHVDLGHNMQYYAAPYDTDISYSAAGRHFLSTYIDWTDTSPERNAIAYEWGDRFTKIAAQYGVGSYLNQVDTGLYPEKIEQSFSSDAWERLGRIRREYDPENRFFSYVRHDA